jgi:hypothetical protein
MSLQTDYAPHDPENIEEAWEAVRLYARDAILATWDGCHKVYLAMDDEQARRFRNSDYADHLTEEDDEDISIIEAVEEWWEMSCSLRFVSAVWTTRPDPNDGYVHLISQFAEEGDEDDDDLDDLLHSDEPERCAVCGQPDEECMSATDGCVRCLACGVLQRHAVGELPACPLCNTPWDDDGQ